MSLGNFGGCAVTDSTGARSISLHSGFNGGAIAIQVGDLDVAVIKRDVTASRSHVVCLGVFK